MTCQRARDTILEADPAELDASGDTELSRHLAACPECRAASATVLSGTAALRDALEDAVSAGRPRSVDSALAELRRKRRRSLPRLVPWAAAAILAAVVVLTQLPEAPPSATEPAIAVPAAAPRPVVEDAGGADIAVFATRDPRITVVWIYQEGIR